jgi:hypothetical protein
MDFHHTEAARLSAIDKQTYVLIPFLFFRSISSVIGYGFDSLGDRVHLHFPPAWP